MRRYFIYRTPYRQLSRNVSSLPIELQRQVRKFRENYYLADTFVIKKLFQKPKNITKEVFIYEENELCYEFFSKKYIGKIIADDIRGEVIISGGFPESVYIGHDDIHYNYGHEVTAEKFAEEVSRYKTYCNELSIIMTSFLSLCSNLERFYSDERSRKNRKQAVQSQENLAWMKKHLE